MRGDDVEGLHERLLRDLPVAAQHLRDVHLFEPVLERPPVEVGAEIAEERVERLTLRVEVHEHEAAPCAHVDLGQVELVPIDMRKVPLGGDLLQGPVEVPAVSVERAAQLGREAIVLAKQPTPVQACVVEGLDRVGADRTIRIER